MDCMRGESVYEFSAESVHIVNTMTGGTARFKCRRCCRNLPENQFAPLWNFPVPKGRIPGSMQIALHPVCHKCREQLRGKWVAHPMYSVGLDRFFDRLTIPARVSAKKRGILFAIEKDDLLGMYIEQNGKCALTGHLMDWTAKGKVGRGNKAYMAPSIDRIDSQGNYVLSNVHLVLAVVNIMKNELTVRQFRDVCRLVSEYEIESQLGAVAA